MAKIRGSALIPRINYLKTNHAEVWPRIVEALQPDTRAMIEANPLATAWFELEKFADLMLTADRVAGNDDLELVRKLGNHAATANLTTILRIFVRLGSPEFIVGKAAKVWNLYHDSGRAEVERVGHHHLALQVLDYDQPHPAVCATLIGWLRGYVEAAGGKAVGVKESRCRLAGQDCCRFEARWD